MTAFETIKKRRSVRAFLDTPVEREKIEIILDAARSAPSAHNEQPWRFVVINSQQKKEKLMDIFENGIESGKNAVEVQHHAHYSKAGMTSSLAIMKEAPVNVLVFHAKGTTFEDMNIDLTGKFAYLADQLSIGSAIENFILAAREMELGTRWIGHIVAVYEEIGQWLNTKDQLVAGIAVGYPVKWPHPRLRKSLDEIVTWL